MRRKLAAVRGLYLAFHGNVLAECDVVFAEASLGENNMRGAADSAREIG